jgi:hypothetical protein
MADRYWVDGSGVWNPTYTSAYPPAYNSTYVKATTTYAAGYDAWLAFNPALSLTGGYTNNEWLSSYTYYTNHRIQVDLGEAKQIGRIYYENHHNSGGSTTFGLKNFTFWGTNTGAAFSDVTWISDVDMASAGWVALTCATNQMAEHVGSDVVDPHYIVVTNSTAYRYYAFKFADNWGSNQHMAVRRIELQTGGDAHWATSSGGAANIANTPTSSDNVIFDSNSHDDSYTVTINAEASCADMTWANPSSGNPTVDGTAALNIYGSLTLISGMTNSYTGTITFKATSGTKTIDTDGVALGSPIVLDGSGGTFQLADSLTTTGNLTNTNGTFDANSKTVTLNGTQQTITGTFAFYNLTRTGTATTTDFLIFTGNYTISNTLTLTGNSATNRLMVGAATLYARTTLTVNGSVAFTNVKFRNVTGAGTALPFLCGTGCQNFSGNSGIVFSGSYIKGVLTTTGL